MHKWSADVQFVGDQCLLITAFSNVLHRSRYMLLIAATCIYSYLVTTYIVLKQGLARVLATYMQIYLLYLVHIELPPHNALIHCSIRAVHRGCTVCTIDFSRGFWYGTLPCPMMFESAKLLAASMSAVEWYKSRAHISFLSEVIHMGQLNMNEV